VQTPGEKQETNPAARNWQIRMTPGISTMDPPGHRSTAGHRLVALAGRTVIRVPVKSLDRAIREKAEWDQHRGAKRSSRSNSGHSAVRRSG
jgi:hypothetical protein